MSQTPMQEPVQPSMAPQPLSYHVPTEISQDRKLAARFARIFGILCLLGAMCIGFVSLGILKGGRGGGRLTGLPLIMWAIMMAFLLFNLASGVLYTIGAIMIDRRSRLWTMIVMVLAIIHAGLASLSVLVNVIHVNIFSILLFTFFVVAIGQLIAKLVKVRREDAVG